MIDQTEQGPCHECPPCERRNLVQNGRDRRGASIYRCGDCARSFAALTGTPFSGHSFPAVIGLAVRWFRRFRLSYAEVVEWLAERSTTADPSTEFDWVQKFAPLYEEAAKGHRHRVGQRWSVNETYVKVAGRWGYVYRAIQSQPFSFAPASYSTPADPNKTLWGYCRERLDVTKEDVKEIEGVYRIGDTRVSLNSLVYLFREGLSTESMVESYPSLTLEQVHGALAFYLANRADIDRYLAEGQRLPSRSTSYHATTMLS